MRGVDGGTVDREHCGRLCGGQRGSILSLRVWRCNAVKECPDGIDAIDGSIPHLRTLLLQQPATHLIDGLHIVWRYHLDSFDSSHLRRNLVVVPRIACTRSIIVTAHLLSEYGIFFQTLHIFGSLARFAILREDDSREGLLINSLTQDVLLQQRQQVVVGSLHVTRQFPSVEGTEIEPAQGRKRRERRLAAFLLLFLHLLHQINDFIADEFEGLVFHLLRGILRSRHPVQTYQHLFNSHRDIRAALHARIPRERTVAVLQLLQLLEGRRQAVRNSVLVEEVGESLFLLTLAVSSPNPRCLAEHEVLQFLVFLQL